jgi:hypothetical protein
LDELFASISEIFEKIAMYPNFAILENELGTDTKVNPRKKNFWYF